MPTLTPEAGLKPRYDVIVFGAGPAGAAAAAVIARKGLSVALLGKPANSAPRIGETVPPEVTRVLAQLGLCERFRTHGHIAAPGIVAMWGDERPHENDFLFNAYGPGWHLDRARFDDMLREAARHAGADVCDSAVVSCSRGSQGWSVQVGAERGARTLGRWAIDATGRAAWLARQTGARRERSDRLVALVRFAAGPGSGETRTLIEAQAYGWWYAAPLPDNRAIVALFTDPDLLPGGARARAQLWDRSFAATRLISSFASFSTSPLYGFPASSARSSLCAGHDWIAIGDAAQSHDPLSGQGIVKAMISAMRAAEFVAAGRQAPADIEEFRDTCDREYEQYLMLRRAHYRREQRWPGQPFWRRRHQADELT